MIAQSNSFFFVFFPGAVIECKGTLILFLPSGSPVSDQEEVCNMIFHDDMTLCKAANVTWAQEVPNSFTSSLP